MWQNTYENWVPDPTDDLPTLTVATSPNFASDNIVFAGIQDAVVRSYDWGDSWDAAGLAVPPPVVTALALSPNFVNDHMLLAGTYEDGIFRSEDGGRRWRGANFGLLDLNVMALVVSPDFANDTTAFAGTTRACLRARTVGWREVELPRRFTAVYSMALSPNFADDNTLFAGTEEHGLLRLTDRRQSWEAVGAGQIEDPLNSILLSGDVILLIVNDALWQSPDGGLAWSVLRDEDVTAVAASPDGGRNS